MRFILFTVVLFSSTQALARPKTDAAFEIIDASQRAVTNIDQQLSFPSIHPAKREELTQQRAQNLDKIDEAADSAPKEPTVQARALGAFMSAKEYPRALPRADKVVMLAPNNPQAYVMRGNVKRAMGDMGGAEADATTALKLDPHNKDAQALFALTHGRGGASSASRSSRDDAGGGQAAQPAPREVSPAAFAPAQNAPRMPSPIVAAGAANADRLKAFDLFKQAEAKTSLGDDAAAKVLLDRAAEADKTNPHVLAARAQARLKTGDATGAYADASAALMLDGRHAKAYLARAAAGEALHKPTSEVLADYRLAADLDPDLAPEVQAVLARHGHAAKPATGAQAPAENLQSGSLPPVVRKNLPLILIGLALVVFGGGALWLRSGGGSNPS